MKRFALILTFSLCAFVASTTFLFAQRAGQTPAALNTITSEDILRHTRVLSSDEYEGRAPGTRGEDLTVKYLTDEFKRLGLKPGNPDGTYTQKVPLAGFTAQPTASFEVKGEKIDLSFPNDYVAVSRRYVPEVNVANSDVVFVGYGVVAPEYGWDDYKGLDVRGKTVIMLINDPAVADANDASKLDDKMFKGRAMTYYGRWTYKYEIASEKGAAACIIVHETTPAGYPYEVVSGSWGRENFDIVRADKNAGRVGIEAWITENRAQQLFTASGQNFNELKKAATRKNFKPVTLDARANFTLKNTLRTIDSRNVIAKTEGSDARLKNEYVIYTAHWDHLGRDTTMQGDGIFNGALDNASGTAGLLEIAEAFTKIRPAPKRTILFLAVTAEEKGLLGAKYYATNPLYPLNKTLANINMDGVNQWGKTRDIIIVGLGNSTLDDLLRATAAKNNRIIKPDSEPEKGFFYRSDHFEFAKQGVPALYTDAGDDFINKPAGYAQTKRDEYTARDYHKVSDEIKPDWDLSGAVEDLRLLATVGYAVAQGARYPEWKPGTEFRARREESLKQQSRR
ncbi:MAG: M28 family metallopeptidase [Pyrinomonadaceae bacterium MAG19_C2-C3]|nr:M28 family metallopeptidase [Pyrinomonadaceae bacterium MAG19_C2-C3]